MAGVSTRGAPAEANVAVGGRVAVAVGSGVSVGMTGASVSSISSASASGAEAVDTAPPPQPGRKKTASAIQITQGNHLLFMQFSSKRDS